MKAASDVMTPVGGTITSVNEELTKEPSLINKHPESEGLLKFCAENRDNLHEHAFLSIGRLSKTFYTLFRQPTLRTN